MASDLWMRALVIVGLVASITSGMAMGDSAWVRAASPEDSAPPPGALVDEALRFRLDPPGFGWTLLTREQAAGLNSSASAGAIHSTGQLLMVIHEAVGSMKAADLAQLVMQGMPLEDKQEEKITPFTAEEGTDAVEFRLRGVTDGIAFRYRGRIRVRDGYAWQTIAMGPEGITPADSPELLRILDAFHLLPGPVQMVARTPPLRDVQGEGWRVREGIFQSVDFGYELEPGPGWNLEVGNSLQTLNPSAEVGLVSADGQSYLVVIPERVPEGRHAGTREFVKERMLGEMGSRIPEGEMEVQIGGISTPLLHARSSERNGDAWLGVACQEQRCLQVMSWCFTSLAGSLETLLKKQFPKITDLPEAKRKAIAKEMDAARGPTRTAGEDWALRGGRYTDWGAGFSWTLPGGEWRIKTGQEARGHHPDARLVLLSPRLGLHMAVKKGEGNLPLQEWHQLQTKEWLSHVEGKTRTGTWGGVKALVEEGTLGNAQVLLGGRVLTVGAGGSLYHARQYGYPEWMQAGRKELARVEEAFQWMGMNKTWVTADPGRYQDERVGFEVRLPKGNWTWEDTTPEHVRPLGVTLGWTGEGDRYIGVVGMALGSDERGRAEVATLVEKMIRETVGRRLGALAGEPKVRGDAALAGKPSRLLSWSAGPSRLDAWLRQEGEMLYALIVAGPAGEAPEGVRSGFRLLE